MRYYSNDVILNRQIEQLSKEAIWNQPISSYEKLGWLLESSSDDRLRNNEYVYALTDCIQFYIPVGRFYVSGPYGRRTNIGTIDIDVIVLLINFLPPYSLSGEAASSNLIAKLRDYLISEKSTIENRCQATVSIELCISTSPCYILINIDSSVVRIFLAPCLGRTSEEQRQIVYTYLMNIHAKSGLEACKEWFPALYERPSEDITKSPKDVIPFMRTCCLWAKCLPVTSLRIYAIEILAYFAAKNQLKETSAAKLDFKNALLSFFQTCSKLSKMEPICNIDPPATCPVLWKDAKKPVLTDHINPYDNLLESLTPSDIKVIENAALYCAQRLQSESRPLRVCELVSMPKSSILPTLASSFAVILVILISYLLTLYKRFNPSLSNIQNIDWVSILRSDYSMTLNNYVEPLFKKFKSLYQGFTFSHFLFDLTQVKLFFSNLISQLKILYSLLFPSN